MQDKEESCQDFEIRFCCPADLPKKYQTNTEVDSLIKRSTFERFSSFIGLDCGHLFIESDPEYFLSDYLSSDYINFDSFYSNYSLSEDCLGELKELYSLIYSEKDFDFDDYDAGKLSIR